MPQLFLQTLTTPDVVAARERHGSRTAIERMVSGWDTTAALGEQERDFIAARDGFYLASVGSTGWPYVQFRGGPPGFLHVLSDTRLGWADLRGNRQYLTVGNIAGDDRVALFLMDYAHRARLKVIGHASVVDVADDPQLLDRLGDPGEPGKVERAVVVDVVAYDWNCQQHITPRFTEAELAGVLGPVRDELETLRRDNAQLRAQLADASGRTGT